VVKYSQSLFCFYHAPFESVWKVNGTEHSLKPLCMCLVSVLGLKQKETQNSHHLNFTHAESQTQRHTHTQTHKYTNMAHTICFNTIQRQWFWQTSCLTRFYQIKGSEISNQSMMKLHLNTPRLIWVILRLNEYVCVCVCVSLSVCARAKHRREKCLLCIFMKYMCMQ